MAYLKILLLWSISTAWLGIIFYIRIAILLHQTRSDVGTGYNVRLCRLFLRRSPERRMVYMRKHRVFGVHICGIHDFLITNIKPYLVGQGQNFIQRQLDRCIGWVTRILKVPEQRSYDDENNASGWLFTLEEKRVNRKYLSWSRHRLERVAHRWCLDS